MEKKIKICSECGDGHNDDLANVCKRCYQRNLMSKLWYSDVGSIYIITNTINGMMYVGSTSRKPDQRWQNHKDTIFNAKDRSYNTALKKDMRFFGFENFKFDVISTCDKADQKFEEQRLIDELRDKGERLYNSIDAVTKKAMQEWYLNKTTKLITEMGLAI